MINKIKFSKELEKSSGVKTPKVIEYVWKTITPVLVVIIMCFSIVGYKRIEYGDYVVCIYFLYISKLSRNVNFLVSNAMHECVY